MSQLQGGCCLSHPDRLLSQPQASLESQIRWGMAHFPKIVDVAYWTSGWKEGLLGAEFLDVMCSAITSRSAHQETGAQRG